MIIETKKSSLTTKSGLADENLIYIMHLVVYPPYSIAALALSDVQRQEEHQFP